MPGYDTRIPTNRSWFRIVDMTAACNSKMIALAIGLGILGSLTVYASVVMAQAAPSPQTPPSPQTGNAPAPPAGARGSGGSSAGGQAGSGKPAASPPGKAAPGSNPAGGGAAAPPPVKQAANPLILTKPVIVPEPTDGASQANATSPGEVDHDYSGLRPGSKLTSKTNRDYTHPTRPAVVGAKELNAFGYDYFAAARASVDALRAYYQRNPSRPSMNRSDQSRRNDSSINRDSGSIDPSTGLVSPSLRNGATQGGTGAAEGAFPLAGLAPGATGLNPSTGGQGTLQPERSPVNGLSGADNLNSSPSSLQSGTGPEPFTQPQGFSSFGPIDVRSQVFGPIQGQFHNITAEAPAKYQLGPGDVISIQFSSPTREAQTLRRSIDGSGKINLQGLGVVSLVGKTLSGAEKALELQLQRYYKGVQVSVSLDQIRSISVSVVGHAYEPGTYAVPAVIATAYNLLWWAGGPADDGSLRDIEVKRQGKTIGTLDLYKYELGGGSSDDIQLEQGDVLYIPGKLSTVAVQGEVRTEALYELKPGETLQDALRFTGGIKASAVAQRVQINTVEPGASRVLRDIDLNSPAAQKTPIFDGDVVEVLSVRNYLTNSVTIEGAVDQPSDYALTANMRVSDLVNRARGLMSEAYPIAELHHWNADLSDTLVRVDLDKALAHDPANDLPLTRWDRIKVYTRAEVAFTGRHIITITGQVSKHGVYTASRNMHVSDALRMAGGPLPDAYLDRAVLMHQHEDGPPSMEFVNLRAIMNGDSSKDPLVLDNDQLAVYAVGQAQFTPDHIVTVSGQVVAPGPYPRAEDMTVTSLLTIAGGFKPDAGSMVVVTHARRVIDEPGANLVKVAIRFDSNGHCPPGEDLRLEDGDLVTIQGRGGFVDTVQTITVSGAVQSPGPIPITSKELRLTDAIKLAGGLRKEAYPLGAEFHRDPSKMLTDTQQSMAKSIGKLRDLLNGTQFQRESAKARLEIITATGQAEADAAGAGILGGLVGGGAAATAALPGAAAGAVSSQLAGGQVPVTQARLMGEGQNEPDGALAINLPSALLRPGGHEDILLKDGDQITIPETPTTVQLIGAIYHPSGVVWQPDKPIEYYINLAGGMTFDAAKDGIEVIRAGGGIVPAKKVHEILPGDVILVPTKPIAASIAKHSNAIGDFFKSLTSTVLVYALAKSLFGL